MTEYDPGLFDTEDGLLGAYTGTIEDSWFATDLKYMNGDVPLLHWNVVDIKAPDAEEVPDEIVEKYSVGSNWEIVDRSHVEHTSGNPKRKFNKQSKYGRIIDVVVKGREGAFKGLLDIIGERGGDPRDATVWAGLRFDFERVTVNYGGDIGERSFILPAKFVGKDGEGKTAAGTEAVDKDVVLAGLTAAASAAGSYEEFVGKAFQVDGLTEFDDLVEQVSSPDGFYATAGV